MQNGELALNVEGFELSFEMSHSAVSDAILFHLYGSAGLHIHLWVPCWSWGDV